MGSGLVSLYFKGVLLSKLFIISRNWLTSPGSTKPQVSKHQDTENKIECWSPALARPGVPEGWTVLVREREEPQESF